MTRMTRISRAPVLSATFNRDSCCTMTTLFRLLHNGHDPPALVARERPGLHDPDLVADLALVLLVVCFEPGRLLNVLLVLGVLLEGLDADDHGLIHLVADDGAGPRFAHGALRMVLTLNFSHVSNLSNARMALKRPSRRARPGATPCLRRRRLGGDGQLRVALGQMDRGQNLGQVLAHVPDLAMVLQLAGRHLEAQVEQLLTGVLELLLQVGHRQALEIFHLHFLPSPLAGLAGAAAAALGAAPGAAFGAAPGAALIDGAAPGAAFGPFAAAPAATAGAPAMAPGIPPSAISPGFSSAGPWIFTSAAALTPDLIPSVRVRIGNL